MNITPQEKLMYEVMKAIYESGIPISFKGSMVLKACLLEAGYSNETRHTVDIDANWNTESAPSADQMTESIQNALNKSNIDLEVKIYRMYGIGRSAGFELRERKTKEILFSMDIDVNRPVYETKIYEIDGVHFCGVTASQMIADKLYVVSTDKVFRRIKDVVDLYYLSKVFIFDKGEIFQALENSNRSLDTFEGFLHKYDDLKHSYEKFRFAGNVEKPPFQEVYNSVQSFIQEVLPKRNDQM